MAVKGGKKKQSEVKVEEPKIEDVVMEEVLDEEEPVEEEKVEETVEVEIPEEKKEEGITVDEEALKVKEDKMPREDKRVRIRMRVDHHCSIAMEHYDLKQGKCYDVPENVKKILDEAGLLAPL